MRRYLMILAVGLLLIPACSDNPNIPATENGAAGAELMKGIDVRGDANDTDRYIVVFTPQTSDPATLTDELARGAGMTVHHRYRRVLRGFSATIPPTALEALRRNPNIAIIERDGVAGIGMQLNPPSWGLDRIDQYPLPLDNRYVYPNTGNGVTVYILDSGIRMDHVEFAGRVSSGYDFIDNDADASDCHGHGTHVAGTVGGSTVGVAKGVSLVAVRVLDCSGYGYWSQVIAGIDYVVNNRVGPSVINMSISGSYSTTLNTAIANAVAAGVSCVVAAGNDNVDASTKSPASATAAITVGATTSTDQRASFSNYGTALDLFAPGASIYSSTMNGTSSYASWSGTSMAAPHVAGVAALYLDAHPAATPADVAGALTAAAGANLLGNIGSGSPNLLLHAQFGGGPLPPAAPTSLTAGSATVNSIVLGWTDTAADENGFAIERSLNGTSWSQVATVGANIVSFLQTGLAAGTPYYFRVRAFNGGGYSSYSNTATATTLSMPAVFVHVAAATASVSRNKSKWRGNLSVEVRDENGQVVSGATVQVTWSGGASGSSTVVTNSSGTATASTSWYNTRSVASVSMTVAGITGNGIQYDAASNSVVLPVSVAP